MNKHVLKIHLIREPGFQNAYKKRVSHMRMPLSTRREPAGDQNRPLNVL